MKDQSKERRRMLKDAHWEMYIEALGRAKREFESETFNEDACAMALYDAKRELGLCAKIKNV